MKGDEVIALCRQLSRFSENPDNTTRTFLCPAMKEVHRLLAQWMEKLGMQVETDAAGNLRGTYPGTTDTKKFVIASHVDTVPNAGAFDGVLGVVLAIALVESLYGRRMPFAIEVVAFSEEEGVRFGVPFMGSRTFVGDVDDTLLATTDAAGISVEQAIRDFGLDTSQMGRAEEKDAFAYLEFHIEQGPVLEGLGLGLALVEAIVGQSRFEITFRGQANHAGTTPMSARKDALAGAAEWVLAVEGLAQSTLGLVATVGQIRIRSGAPNVVPGEAVLILDVRHADDGIRLQSAEALLQHAAEIASRRGLILSHQTKLDQAAVPMDTSLNLDIAEAFRETATPFHSMPSGAGHDAMIVARKIPSAMIFIRSPGGLSHHPDERVFPEDIESALHVGLALLDKLASKCTI